MSLQAYIKYCRRPGASSDLADIAQAIVGAINQEAPANKPEGQAVMLKEGKGASSLSTLFIFLFHASSYALCRAPMSSSIPPGASLLRRTVAKGRTKMVSAEL